MKEKLTIKFVTDLFASIKKSAGNAPVIKLITIYMFVTGGSTFVTWCIFKSISRIGLPIGVFIMSTVIFALLCITPPRIKTHKPTICLMINVPSMKEKFSRIDTDIIPLVKQNLYGCEFVTTHYIKSVFYNIILPPQNGDNIIKIKLRNYFYKHCKADMIIIGHAKIDNRDNSSQFKCNFQLILNPNKEVSSDDQIGIDFFISEHETISISFCLEDNEQMQKSISCFTDIIQVLLNYDPNDPDIVATITEILKKSYDEDNLIFKEYLNKLVTWLINDISNRHTDKAMSKKFHKLMHGVFKQFRIYYCFKYKTLL